MATLLLTPDLATELAQAVEHGVPVETALAAAGLSKQRFYEWLQVAERKVWPHGDPVDPDSLRIITDFADRVGRAQARFEARQVAAIAEAGAAVGRSGIPEWRARAWLLNNHPRYRRTYRQERVTQLEHSGKVEHEHTLAEAATDAELRSWAALELPAPTNTEP